MGERQLSTQLGRSLWRTADGWYGARRAVPVSQGRAAAAGWVKQTLAGARGNERGSANSCSSPDNDQPSQIETDSPINGALVLSDCRHWFSNVACSRQ